MNVLDLLQRHGITPRRVSSHKGGEYHSQCPGCGDGGKGANSNRFHVWPEQQSGQGSWWCRSCSKGGDAIQFLIEFSGLSFPEACRELGRDLPQRLERGTPQPRRQKKAEFIPEASPEPGEAWQAKATALIDYAAEQLQDNPQQKDWLAERGINEETALRRRIGWLPESFFRSRESWGMETILQGNRKKRLWIPRGLVIPDFNLEIPRRLRIRRPFEDRTADYPAPYYVIPDSSSAPIFRAHPHAMVIVESELDGFAIDQAVGNLSGWAALGNSSRKPDPALHQALQQTRLILVALDFDEPDDKGSRAGANAWIWWHSTYPNAERWPVTVGKDPGEAVKAGLNLHNWISAALPSSGTPAARIVDLLETEETTPALCTTWPDIWEPGDIDAYIRQHFPETLDGQTMAWGREAQPALSRQIRTFESESDQLVVSGAASEQVHRARIAWAHAVLELYQQRARAMVSKEVNAS